jgi:hypothetical protein
MRVRNVSETDRVDHRLRQSSARRRYVMKARYPVLVALAAAVTLTSVAAAGPDAAKQRVAITSKGMANPTSSGTFVLEPLRAGALKPDSGRKPPFGTSASWCARGREFRS